MSTSLEWQVSACSWVFIAFSSDRGNCLIDSALYDNTLSSHKSDISELNQLSS